MLIKKLNNCGVEILNIDITNLKEEEYEEIKEIYLEHLIVVIRNQPVLTVPFAKIIWKLGSISSSWNQLRWDKHGNIIENKSDIPINPFTFEGNDSSYPVQRVTGERKNGKLTGIFGTGKLDWHANINFSKVLTTEQKIDFYNGVALQGISEGIKGTSTSWMDTTKAYEHMSDELKERCENVLGHFECSPEVWAEGLPNFQYEGIIKLNTKNEYVMPLLNKSKYGKTGLYFHYLNKCKFPSDPELYDILVDYCFQEKFIYTHQWNPGDIVLSDQLLTLHKRDQDGDDMLQKRVLGRYVFNYR